RLVAQLGHRARIKTRRRIHDVDVDSVGEARLAFDPDAQATAGILGARYGCSHEQRKVRRRRAWATAPAARTTDSQTHESGAANRPLRHRPPPDLQIYQGTIIAPSLPHVSPQYSTACAPVRAQPARCQARRGDRSLLRLPRRRHGPVAGNERVAPTFA